MRGTKQAGKRKGIHALTQDAWEMRSDTGKALRKGEQLLSDWEETDHSAEAKAGEVKVSRNKIVYTSKTYVRCTLPICLRMLKQFGDICSRSANTMAMIQNIAPFQLGTPAKNSTASNYRADELENTQVKSRCGLTVVQHYTVAQQVKVEKGKEGLHIPFEVA
ncbi:UNVERIFIED_CONTAM: hypothetical protein K2H54_060528 [Gekko kuhli]